MAVQTTTVVLETPSHARGKMKVFQDTLENGNKFATCQFVFSKTERKKNPKLPIVISITDFHAQTAKASMLKYLDTV